MVLSTFSRIEKERKTVKIENNTKIEKIRFEVIDETGRQYVKYNVNLKFSFQDEGRTLKVFVDKNKKRERHGQ